MTVPNITISRNDTVIELGTIDDHYEGKPEIHTTATADGEKGVEPLSEVTIVDSVLCSGLTVGKTYTLSGILMDKSTGKPLEVDGKQVTAEKKFVAKAATGVEELSYTFNASALAGKAVVVFEDLMQDEKVIASHADIEDTDQTVTFTEPKIGTTATAEGEHTAEPVGEITIIDTVAYSGLIIGKEYTVKGVLMDKATGEKLLVNDKEVTAEASFRASKSEGSIDIPFTFGASSLAGKAVVVFETLYRDKLEVTAHTDINDKSQTVTFTKPEIKTIATVGGEKEVDPAEEITLTDTVTYSGLTPGNTYRLSGILMDKETGEKLLVNDKEITAETEFTPDKADGTVEMVFAFDASGLAGKSIVVFEALHRDSIEVTTHADIDDKDQTVTIRRKGGLLIKKTAEDNFVEGVSFLVTGKNFTQTFTTNADGEIYISGLVPGEYTVTEIADKVTARYEVQEGKTVTVTAGEVPTEVKFHNKLLRGEIVGRKTDTEGNPLEGVLFGLFAKDAKEFTPDKAIATAKTDKNGKFRFDKVPYGEWQIRELEALPGYVVLSNSIQVTVDSGKVTLEDIRNEHTRIVISKVDSATGKELAGAKLEIRDKDGKVIESWTSTDKPHTISKLPAGEYVLDEVSAPKGYELAEDIKFTVKDNSEAITIVMQDKPTHTTHTPNTGDTNWRLALAIFGVSLGGVVIVE